MTFQYTTEYRLGGRRRVCRTYGGVHAAIAISFDLALGSLFGLIGLAIWLVRLSVVTLLRLIAALLALPFKAARAISARQPACSVVKPVWASLSDL